MTKHAHQEQLISPASTAAPLLKWVGGKRQLLPVIAAGQPATFTRYVEPFVGGGAVFFSLPRSHRSTIADLNCELTNLYRVVRDAPAELLEALQPLSQNLGKTAYYNMRAATPSCVIDRAARVLFLNSLCFNGLWRENRQGRMNSPWGGTGRNLDRAIGLIPAASTHLQGTRIIVGGFDESLRNLRGSNWVYADPPYVPTKSGAFSGYSASGFGECDQQRLAERISQLASRGVHVMLSNSDCPEVERIYRPHMDLYRVPAQRRVAASAAFRATTTEIIGVTYPLHQMADPTTFLMHATPI
jgi:DNA adenine methylase